MLQPVNVAGNGSYRLPTFRTSIIRKELLPYPTIRRSTHPLLHHQHHHHHHPRPIVRDHLVRLHPTNQSKAVAIKFVPTPRRYRPTQKSGTKSFIVPIGGNDKFIGQGRVRVPVVIHRDWYVHGCSFYWTISHTYYRNSMPSRPIANASLCGAKLVPGPRYRRSIGWS